MKKQLYYLVVLVFLFTSIGFLTYPYVAKRFFSKNTPFCKDCNILLISLDTCGAKHMSTYGYNRDTTPNLSKIAKQGILFENAHSNASWTLPSHVSIFTGLFPFIHNVQRLGIDTLNKDVPFFPEILEQHGYQTIFAIPSGNESLPIDKVYNRGITSILSAGYDQPGYFENALDQLILNGREHRKTFLFYHTYLCHFPYFVEEQPLLYSQKIIPELPLNEEDYNKAQFTREYYVYLIDRLSQGLQDGEFKIAPNQIREFLEKLRNAKNLTEAERFYRDAASNSMWGEVAMNLIQDFDYWKLVDLSDINHVRYLEAIYDQAMHEMDEKTLGVLYKKLQVDQILQNTIIIVTGDHGEEFMEHGTIWHNTLYDYNTQVPLIVLVPGSPPQRIKEHVQSVDIMPTILDLVGIRESIKFDGQSLLPLITGTSFKNRLIVASGEVNSTPNVTSIREEDWKLFVMKENDKTIPVELYYTKEDSREQNNLLGSHMEKAQELLKSFNNSMPSF